MFMVTVTKECALKGKHCYVHSYEGAVKEFGANGFTDFREAPPPKIVEYFSIGNQVYAQWDNCSESFVLSAEDAEHADKKAASLNKNL